MPAIVGPKPSKTVIDENNIPQELKDRKQWCLWRFIEVNGKWTKPPVSSKTFRKASYKDSIISYDEAVDLYAKTSQVDGIGFVPTADDPYICLDLDSCMTGGKPNIFAKNVVKASQSYAEISPSGKGVRIIVKGELDIPDSKGKAVNGTFEAFESTGYCTMTGKRVSGSGMVIKNMPFMRAVNEGLIHCRDEKAAVISALFHLDNDDLEYDDWLNVMMSIHSFDDSLLWLGELWSSLSHKYVSGYLDAKWKSFDPQGGITVEFLYSRAEKAGWRRPDGVLNEKPNLRNSKHIDKSRTVVIPVETIYEQFVKYSDKMWCENGSLVYEQNGSPVFLSRPTEFTCYLHEKFIPDFSGKGIKEADFFTYVKRKSQPVKSVETAPFFPPLANLAYVHAGVTPGDGQTMDAWLDQWSFASICDRWLTECMAYTLFWPGPPGKRPLFLIMAEGDTKHGAGKTTLAERTAALVSDDDCYFEFDSGAANAFTQEMGVEKKQSKRVILLDNINGSDLQGKRLDKLVTASEIKARRMYVGPVSVPNLFTWIATVNHGKPHQDTASRTVLIKLVKPAKYTPLPEFDRMALWGDIKAFFMRDPVVPTLATRRPEWDLGIAGRMEDPDMILTLINSRAAEIDGTRDDATDWESLIRGKIAQHDLDPDACCCWISTRDLLQIGIASGVLRAGTTSRQLGAVLDKLTPHMPLKQHRKNSGRGWFWVTDPKSSVTQVSE